MEPDPDRLKFGEERGHKLQLGRALHPQTFVDLGCGNGRLLEEIAAAMPDVALAGVDLSTRQIDENRARAPRIEWIAADLQASLPVRRAFDVAVAAEVIEHLDSPEMLLANARAIASHLILTTQSGPVRATERHVGHVRHFTADELRALLAQSGWTPLRVWNEGWPFHDASKWWANRDAEKSLQRFGDRPYGFGERAVCFALRAAFRLNSRSRGAQLYAIARRAS